jgi:hypothetical protein
MESELVGLNRPLADVNLFGHGVFIWFWSSALYVNKHVKASKSFHICLSQIRIYECIADVSDSLL